MTSVETKTEAARQHAGMGAPAAFCVPAVLGGQGGSRPPLDIPQVKFPPPADGGSDRLKSLALRRLRVARAARSRAVLRDVHLHEMGYERVSSSEVVSLETGEVITVDWRGRDRWARPARVATCSWSLGESVGVHHDGAAGSHAHWSGLERCASVWACPVCAAVIRSARAAEIEQAVTNHLANGGAALFFTGTLRHSLADPLAQTLDGILSAWRRTISGAPWRRASERMGIVGTIRTVEVTRGDYGWHPHVHVLLLLDSEPSQVQLHEFRGWLFDRWADCVERSGCRRPLPVGLDMQEVGGDGRVLAQYISKVQGEDLEASRLVASHRWGVGAEMARGDVKTGRAGSRAPFELLDSDSAQDGALWREYYLATKGRRCTTWSRGLRERLGVVDRTDEQIIEDTEAAPMVWVAPADRYRRLLHSAPLLLPVVLEAVESSDWAEVSHLIGGHSARRDDPGPD